VHQDLVVFVRVEAPEGFKFVGIGLQVGREPTLEETMALVQRV
jgi:hypothetical protein